MPRVFFGKQENEHWQGPEATEPSSTSLDTQKIDAKEYLRDMLSELCAVAVWSDLADIASLLEKAHSDLAEKEAFDPIPGADVPETVQESLPPPETDPYEQMALFVLSELRGDIEEMRQEVKRTHQYLSEK